MFPIFQLRLQHCFFKDKQWNNAVLIADETTQRVIQRYQLQLIQQRNVWSLFSHAMTGRETFLQNLDSVVNEQPLRLWLCQPLANFVTFTELPLNWQGLLLFSSHNVAQETNELPMLQWQTIAHGGAPDNAVGVIELNIKDLLSQPSYQIQLNTRQTYWEYRLIQRHQVRLQHPEIIDENGERVFTKPEKYTTETGETAWRSTSGQTQLPMQQVPNTVLKLVDNQLVDVHADRSVQRTVVNALPTPRTDQIHVIGDHPARALSVMTVYL